MNFFTIGDIENLTNIKAHTLRVWEQRYGLCNCKRKESSHRYYDGEDLKQILRIAWLYHQGVKISHIASLSADDIRKKALGEGYVPTQHSIYVNRLLESSIDLDEPAFSMYLRESIGVFGLEATMLRVIFPFLKKIGLFWLTGHVIPSQEHFASSIITRTLCSSIEKLPDITASPTGKSVLMFTPPGEYHEIPLLFMQYLLKKKNVRHANLGSAVSLEVLKTYCGQQHASSLYFHLITNLTKYDINAYLQQLSDAFPDKKIYCSGFACENCSVLPANVVLLASETALSEFAG